MRTQCIRGARRCGIISKSLHSGFRVHPSTANICDKDLQLIEDVISEDQEAALIAFVDTMLKRKRYNKNHFDDVILNYRESEIYPDKLENFPVNI